MASSPTWADSADPAAVSDAVQAAGHLPVSFAESGADLMTVTGHKVGGPLGVGALLVRRDAVVVPQSFGGGQERQIRSGTLDVPAIRAFAIAMERATIGIATPYLYRGEVVGVRHRFDYRLALAAIAPSRAQPPRNP